MTNRCIRISILVFTFGYLSGFGTNIYAQIWENANKTHRSTQITHGTGKTIFSISNRLFISTDLGTTLTVNFPDTGITGFTTGPTGILYLSSPKGIDTTTDPINGDWSMLPGVNLPPVTALFVRIATDSPGKDEIWAGTASGLWKRNGNDTVWQKIQDAGDGAPILQIVAFNKNIYYRTKSTAFGSHDNGVNWKPISTGITNGNITSIVTTSDNDLYVSVSGFPSSHVLQSVDGGISFNGPRGTDFSSRTIQTMVVNDRGDLYLGGGIRSELAQDSITQGFVWRYLANGAGWEDYSIGLPSSPSPEVIALGFSSAGKVFASTDSAGLWRTILPSGVHQQITQSGITLSQNYPNPANTSTEFSIVTDHTVSASVAIFDNLGRIILQLSNGNITQGSHSFSVNTKDMTIGTYFYRLQSPEVTLTKSFIISR